MCAGAVYKYDLSLPPNDMYKLVEEMRSRMKHLPVTVVGYGHMGDSNLHLNISAGALPRYSNGRHSNCECCVAWLQMMTSHTMKRDLSVSACNAQMHIVLAVCGRHLVFIVMPDSVSLRLVKSCEALNKGFCLAGGLCPAWLLSDYTGDSWVSNTFVAAGLFQSHKLL